jgi:hypothetical protein
MKKKVRKTPATAKKKMKKSSAAIRTVAAYLAGLQI